jgi:thiamine biosynthesis protein ThiS
MAITVNGDPHPWHAELTVDRLMVEKKYSFPQKHVFINGERVPKPEWAGRRIEDGDVVEVIHLMSGG